MLDLRFSKLSGRVVISCDSAAVRYLQSLRSRFATSASISNQAFDLEVDDLLVNLRELAEWPSEDTDIHWEPELQRLVEDNAADAVMLQNRLSASVEMPMPAVESPGNGWTAELTEFQRRDFSKLWELSHGANFSVPGAGKTRVALALFHASRSAGEVGRMLVVCPKSAFESWENEAEICFPGSGLRVVVMDSATPPLADVVLINYERLPDCRAALVDWLRLQPTLLVLDEAHRMKLGAAGV